MAALPHAFDVGPASIANAVADGPDAGELIELAAGGGDSGGDGVRVIGDVHGRVDALGCKRPGQLVGQAHAFDLRQIGRVFNDAEANDAGDGDTDRVDRLRLPLDKRLNFTGQQIAQLAAGDGAQCVQFVAVGGIADGRAGQPLVFQPSGYDVLGNYDADGGGHSNSPCCSACGLWSP